MEQSGLGCVGRATPEDAAAVFPTQIFAGYGGLMASAFQNVKADLLAVLFGGRVLLQYDGAGQSASVAWHGLGEHQARALHLGKSIYALQHGIIEKMSSMDFARNTGIVLILSLSNANEYSPNSSNRASI